MSDSEVKPGAVHKSGTGLRPRKTLENFSTRRPSERCTTSHGLRWSSLPPNEVDKTAKLIMEK